MSIPSKRLRLIVALRVSTAGQAVDGYGLPAQERDCRRWNAGAGHRIVHVVADGDEKGGKTGKSTIDEREGLMEAMEWIADGRADGILAPNLDRLARELTVQEAVLAYTWALGGRVFTADHGEHLEDDENDPMRTAMRQMRGVFHQLDRGLIRKRLSDGRTTKGEQGGYAYGAPRFGQQAIDGELVDLDTEKEIEDLILTWHDEEGLGARAICRRLKRGGAAVEARREVAPDHGRPDHRPRRAGGRPGPLRLRPGAEEGGDPPHTGVEDPRLQRPVAAPMEA
ncbi:recombinase family protein [Streptomyces sp. SR27]|uniref:recombinase family protein n=1 Tax=Streptomyces sp. SR27 TaxID=3076630 RepID=UPI00295AE4A3|nr:recombinase family protein [Streptomyces sp. SR27]MDV9186817.1 recombinase family protein [Streptomyces sp. SR27]